jgi:iron complex outermembrane receptor protein
MRATLRLQLGIFFFFLLLLPASMSAQQSSNASSQLAPKRPAQQETVVVTGTFGPVPETEIDRSITVIELPQHGLLSKSWIDELQLVPSVDLQQRGANDIQADLTIRGSTFGQTLVLLNGLRMNDVQSGHHDMDLPLPTSSIQRIEILRGAGSTLYGSDAMAGSVNVITATPERSDFRLGAGVGNFGVNQETGSVSFLHKNFDEEFDAQRDFSSGFRADRDYRSLTLFSTTGIKTGLGYSLLMLGYGDKPFGADQFYGNFNSWERTKSWFAGLKQPLGTKTEFDFGLRRHTDEFVLFRNQPQIFENNHIDKSWQADIRRHDPVSKNSSFYYGAEGIHESIASNNLGNHERSRGAVYLDYDVRVLRRFSFSIGAREEIFSSAHGELSPTASAGVWLRQGLKLKASASRAFRLPSFTDLEYHDPANFGNPTIGPEKAWDYEGGLLWNPGSRLSTEITVFERRDQNVIDYVLRACSAIPADQLPPGTSCSMLAADVYHAENLQRLNFFGVETSAELRLPHDGRLQFSYTALRGAQQSLGALQTKYVFNYPANDGMVAWTGRLPGRMIARTRIGLVDRLARDPYGLWDAAVMREFPHFAAHMVLSNLTNTGYEEIPGVIMPGRSIIFGLDFFLRER